MVIFLLAELVPPMRARHPATAKHPEQYCYLVAFALDSHCNSYAQVDEASLAVVTNSYSLSKLPIKSRSVVIRFLHQLSFADYFAMATPLVVELSEQPLRNFKEL